MVEQPDKNVYWCRLFTEDITYEMDTKEIVLKNCNCPDQTKMCWPFSFCALAAAAQQERSDAPNEEQDLLCREMLKSTDQNIRILLAKYKNRRSS